MSPIFQQLGIDRLSLEERLKLISEIWESLAPSIKGTFPKVTAKNWSAGLRMPTRILPQVSLGKKCGSGCERNNEGTKEGTSHKGK